MLPYFFNACILVQTIKDNTQIDKLVFVIYTRRSI
nr:MAG TPA: hypothetical protein [Caudoviricetes sp.]